MNDFEIFKTHLPVFMEDINEPFHIAKIGCTLYTEPQKSVSSRFEIFMTEEAESVLEYALFWHYDIQHLYDLEHVFLFLDKNGNIIDTISSFHGKFYRQSKVEFKNNRPILYLQPGKHAVMACPEYFKLFVDFYEACNKKAGTDGVLVPDFLSTRLSKTETDDIQTEKYIKTRFSFTPAEKYTEAPDASGLLTDWNGLTDYIVSSINAELSVIRNSSY